MTPLVFTRLLRASSALTPVMLAALAFTPAALANPTGGTVKAGQAEITTPDPSTLLINQSTNRAVIDWKKFDIDAGETTRFKQPSSQSWTLNRVVGSQDPSRILGNLEANGNVVIVNPDGIHFGPGSRIDVNRLIATTSGISDDNFMSGNMVFDQPGNLSASIVNEGTITINDYGLAALVAPSVRNSGVINARLGQINLASGNKFTIDPYGDGLVKLSIGDEIKNEIYDVATGKKITDLVKNDGTLKANGGIVAMTATTARKIVNSVVNNTGVIEANTVGRRGGKIILGARTASSKRRGAPRQVVRVSGRLQATAYPVPTGITVPTPAPTARGKIEITGEVIAATNAIIDASGVYGGGTILIGGDYMGGNGDPDIISGYDIPLENYVVPAASVVTLDEDVVINADGVDNADGGKVIVWSDEATVTAAKITARGGEDSGDGGFIETSGKFLSALKAADASASHGAAGTWLLDPLDSHIKNAPNANFAVTVETIHPGSFGFPSVTGNSAKPTASPSVISTATIEGAINTGTHVRVITRGTVGGEPGDIYVEDDITKTAGGDVFVSIDSANNVYFSPNVDLVSTSGRVAFQVYAFQGKIFGNNVGRIDVNGGQFLLTARDGIDFNSTGDMPDHFSIYANRSGPSPLPQVNIDVTFDGDKIEFSHSNTTALFPTNGIRLVDSSSNGALHVDLTNLNLMLQDRAILVQNNRTWRWEVDAGKTHGTQDGYDLNGVPEIVSNGNVNVDLTNTKVAGIIPVVEVDATNANNCYGLTCIATGPSGQALINAYANPPLRLELTHPISTPPISTSITNQIRESSILNMAERLRPGKVKFSRDYDRLTAIESALLSELAYKDTENVRKSLSKMGYKFLKDLHSKSGNDAYFASKIVDGKKTYFVFIRGTEGLVNKDMARNFMFKNKKINNVDGKVNSGMGRLAEDVYNEFFALHPSVLNEVASGKARLHITGHSLGGAAAQILAAMAVESDLKIVNKMQVYSFGSPAVGNGNFRNAYGNLNIKRVMAPNDPWADIGWGKGLGKGIKFAPRALTDQPQHKIVLSYLDRLANNERWTYTQ